MSEPKVPQPDLKPSLTIFERMRRKLGGVKSKCFLSRFKGIEGVDVPPLFEMLPNLTGAYLFGLAPL